MKVSELTGIALDYFVCEAAGMLRMIPGTMEEKLGGYSPSTNWRLGGPIIERMIESGEFCVYEYNGIVTVSNHDPEGLPCKDPASENIARIEGQASTLLIAAMRAFVASKFGDEVDDAQPQSAG
ncbi:TPA: DUF2591 family protein [Burkholderia cepacia]|nr:hypothetical protein BZY94_06040 [Burkholderia territorii]HDR9497017.1 DUF2591 family protein [Burkholderia cepacia]